MIPERRPLIVGIGGTVRSPSSSERVLVAALAAAEAAGARTKMIGGEVLSRLPIFNPTDAEHPPERSALVDAVRGADGVIVSTPGYHGSLSGLIKNALDSLEPLREDARPYLDGRAVGCIVVADGWQACGSALASLRSIVHALRGWPTPLGATINSATKPFDDAGALTDPRDVFQVEMVAKQVVDFARAFSPPP
ncbi:MAG TPA: NADPH-dependent FMN reductase [Caulobacteraceae bacterium]|jgi:FMN reductase|nr:NADPH-dependent FMN reductase [Caulobacteraceae bacterium]